MPHLLIEIARGVIERQMLSVPIELDPSGAPADILAPPLPIRRSLSTPFGTLRVQLIVRTVTLRPIAGSAQATITMTFDEGSIEALSLDASVGLRGDNMTASAALIVRQEVGAGGRPIARFGVDLSASVATFQLDAVSQSRLAAAVGPTLVAPIESTIAAMLTVQLRSVGFYAVGLTLGLTPGGVPSEDLLDGGRAAGVVWVNAETLALALSYASEASPVPFQPVPCSARRAFAESFGLTVNADDALSRRLGDLRPVLRRRFVNDLAAHVPLPAFRRHDHQEHS